MNNNYITKVYLLDVPLESDYKNTLYFTDINSQQSYFSSCKVREYTDFSYQRKDQIIRVPEIYDNIFHCNYVMYQNSNYNNKWFYAFIKNLKYINDGTTEIEIETDVIQTWLFDYQLKPSFVEREHVDNDTIGLHTIPESLETGEYINQIVPEGEQNALQIGNNAYICLAVSEMGIDAAIPSGERKYNGVYSGLIYLVFPSGVDVDRYIKETQTSITEDNIVSMFMIPRSIIEEPEWLQRSYGGGYRYDFLPYSQNAKLMGYNTLSKPVTIDNYQPRNNKLYCYPYRYLMISNNAGINNVFQYEHWKEDECTFEVRGAIGVGCAIKLIPYNYKMGTTSTYARTILNYSEGVDAPKLPTCAWTNDSYVNWLTGNALSFKLQTAGNIGQIAIGGALLASGVGSLAGGALMLTGIAGVGNQMKERYEHSLVPDTAKGSENQGDLIFADRLGWRAYKMCIKQERAKIIDQFFDMFGYQVNSVKIPNKAHRSRYWYTKTIDANIDGNIPNEDMQKIKDAYNRGITFWRNASEIQNYSLSNNIV